MSTVADHVASVLREAGTGRMFGMPGGGSIAELIQAAGNAGLPFTLAHTEAAAAFMACAQAELSGRPGVCLATLGPGAASLVNGVAHAWLDRVPLVAITDCRDATQAAVMQHQTLRQTDIFSSFTKWSATLSPEGATETLSHAVAEALGPPSGPVHLDCPTEVVVAPVASHSPAQPFPLPASRFPTTETRPVPNAGSMATWSMATERLLRSSRRPLLLLGLGARTPEACHAVRALSARHGIPALATYKAKGVVADADPWFAGVLTNGALERPVLEAADLFIAAGLDPVELLPRPWSLATPVIGISTWAMAQRQVPMAAELVGDVPQLLEGVSARLSRQSAWHQPALRTMADDSRSAMRTKGEAGRLWPHRVVELVSARRPGDRVTVDAGAHMFPALSLWPVREPYDLLISNGLSTMGFALPAAIGAALFDRRPTTVLTGDGGLLMCLAELRTAARERLPLRIVVFDDQALSLIKIKQIQRGFRTDGVSLDGVDWPALSKSLGVPGLRADSEPALERCLADTASLEGPALIAAAVDPTPYETTMRTLRG